MAGAGRRLGAVGHHPPLAIWGARQVHRIKMQGHVVMMADRVARAQETRLAVDQRRRQQPFAQHLLLAIHVAKDLVEQGGALDHRRLDAAPFVGRQDQRQGVQVPWPLAAVAVGRHIVGDAVFAHLALHHLVTLAHHARRFVRQVGQHRAPVRTRRPGRVQHFIIAVRRGQVMGE